MRSRRGFTLIEMMIVIAIVGVIIASYLDPVQLAWRRVFHGLPFQEGTSTALSLKRHLDKDLQALLAGAHPRWSARYDIPDGHELLLETAGGKVTYTCTVGTVTRSGAQQRRFSGVTLTETGTGSVRTFHITVNNRPGLPVLVSYLEAP
jgi:prepilin-type N-terminal cleavage/methylation domain-containing protein